MKECRYCRSIYDDSLAACPNCGGNKIITAEDRAEEAGLRQKEIENREKAVEAPIRQRKTIIGIIVAIVVVVVAVVGIVSYNANKPLSNGMSKDEGDQVLASGISHYESGNYKEAIRCFAQLPLDSKQYKEAQSILLKSSDAYCEEIAETAEKYVQNGEYEIALELLENAQALLPNAAELQELYNTTYADYKTYISTTAIEGAEEYIANGDYESAINVLRDAISKIEEDVELATLLSQYEEKYCDYIIQQANAALELEGYQSAISIIKQAQDILPNNDSLKSAIVFYESYAPVYLANLEYFDQEYDWYKVLESDMDNLGNEYHNSIACRYLDNTYILNGDYSRLCGTLYQRYEYRDRDHNGHMEVYADGVLIFSEKMSAGIYPINFELDVIDVNELRIVVAHSHANTGVRYIALGNCYLQK